MTRYRVEASCYLQLKAFVDFEYCCVTYCTRSADAVKTRRHVPPVLPQILAASLFCVEWAFAIHLVTEAVRRRSAVFHCRWCCNSVHCRVVWSVWYENLLWCGCVLLSACRGETLGGAVKKLYMPTVQWFWHRGRLQLQMLPRLCSGNPQSFASVSIFAAFFQTRPLVVRILFCEVERLLQLLLVVPASSETAQRSFNCRRRLKI